MENTSVELENHNFLSEILSMPIEDVKKVKPFLLAH